jgi:hypothetical protein
MYCSKCGKQLNEGIVFCGQCGQRVGEPVKAKANKGKGISVAAIVLALLIGGVFGGHFLGLYTLPFLTDSVNAVSVLRADGTVNIERAPDTLTAREGMRLQNLDTIRTGGDGSAWLSLDEVKAVGLSELTALCIDRGTRGFTLTLVAGEIRAQIDQPLAADEDFTVQAGNLALAVRGTVFTASYDGSLVSVNVESGTVAVLDEQGKEIAVLNAGESGEYEAGLTSASEPTPTPPADEQGQTQTPTTPPTPFADYEVGNIVVFGDYEWRVLEMQGGKALLLSEYALEDRAYNSEHRSDYTGEELRAIAATWADCDLRAYLNGEFLNSFSQSDRERIAETRVANNDNPWFNSLTMSSGNVNRIPYPAGGADDWIQYAPTGGADTTDKIFLLSIEEVVKYFGDSGQLGNRPSSDTGMIEDEYNEARIARWPSGHAAYWWLRSPGFYSYYAAAVDIVGDIIIDGAPFFLNGAVRPAMWVVID